MTNASEIIARLEGGETGSIIDGEIFRHFGNPLPDKFATQSLDLEWTSEGVALMALGDLEVTFTPPAYTTSLDAAVSLAQRVLPEWQVIDIAIGWRGPGKLGDDLPEDVHEKYGKANIQIAATATMRRGAHSYIAKKADAPTPAAALVAALLKAKEAGDV